MVREAECGGEVRGLELRCGGAVMELELTRREKIGDFSG
jgi:hypothetical protein